MTSAGSGSSSSVHTMSDVAQPRRHTCRRSCTAARGSNAEGCISSSPDSMLRMDSTLLTMPSSRRHDAPMACTRKRASSSAATLPRAASSWLAARPDCAGVRSSWLMESSRLRSACSFSFCDCRLLHTRYHDGPFFRTNNDA